MGRGGGKGLRGSPYHLQIHKIPPLKYQTSQGEPLPPTGIVCQFFVFFQDDFFMEALF